MIAEVWESGGDGHEGQEGKITKWQKGAFNCDGTYVHYLAGRDGFTDFCVGQNLLHCHHITLTLFGQLCLKLCFKPAHKKKYK